MTNEGKPRTARFALRLTAAAVGLLGLAFAVGGVWLAVLGGSLYYAIAGVGLCVSAWLLWHGRPAGAWWFWAVLAGTFAWTWWESGANFWRWVPRWSR